MKLYYKYRLYSNLFPVDLSRCERLYTKFISGEKRKCFTHSTIDSEFVFYFLIFKLFSILLLVLVAVGLLVVGLVVVLVAVAIVIVVVLPSFVSRLYNRLITRDLR